MPQTAEQIVAFARQAVGTTYAGITLQRSPGRLVTIAATDPLVEQADELQYELSEGPCLEAARRLPTVLAVDIGHDPRWPRWGPAARSLGLVSVLSAQLRARGRRIGRLNLYGDQPRQFSGGDAAIAHLFAIHAAVALASALEEQHLHTAIESRTQIGQAQGILMERFELDSDQAFRVLRRYSQTTNTKLHQVAQTLIATRELPDTEPDN